MINLLFIGDIHLSDAPPRSRKDNYTEAIFAKLVQCCEVANRYQHVFMTGDVFHKKRPEVNSHHMVGAFMDTLRCFPKGRTYSLVGNHDIRDGNMGTLPEQPLGVIFKTGLLQPLDRDMVFVEGSTTVQVSPLPFSYLAETNPSLYECKRLPGVDYVIRMTHASILPVGMPQLVYKMPHVGVEKVWGQSWDLLVNGHVHHGSEVISIPAHKQSFVNVGAIARGALNSWALETKPRILGVHIEKGDVSFEWHNIIVRPAEEVFRVEDAVRMKEHKAGLNEFVDGIKSREVSLSAQTFDLVQMLDEFLQAQEGSESVKRKVKEYAGLR